VGRYQITIGVMANMYMLGYACGKNFIRLRKESILDGIREAIPEKYSEMNRRIFDFGFEAKEGFNQTFYP